MNPYLEDNNAYPAYEHTHSNLVQAYERRQMWVKTFAWMFGAMLLSALAAYLTIHTGLFRTFLSGGGLIAAVIIELGLVIAISAGINRLSARAAFALFMLYSIVNGVTLSVVLLLYTLSSVVSTFLITGAMFAVMALLGATTKVDLSRFSSILFMSLVGIIIASVVNIFLKSSTMDWIISFVGVVLFSVLTAYDVQRYNRLYSQGALEGEAASKIAVLAALSLYLDFVNLFLMLLRIFGNRR